MNDIVLVIEFSRLGLLLVTILIVSSVVWLGGRYWMQELRHQSYREGIETSQKRYIDNRFNK